MVQTRSMVRSGEEWAFEVVRSAWVRSHRVTDEWDPVTQAEWTALWDAWVFWDPLTERYRAVSCTAWLRWFSVSTRHPLLETSVPGNLIDECVARCTLAATHARCAWQRREAVGALVRWVRMTSTRDIRNVWWRSLYRHNREGLGHSRVNTMLLSLGMCFDQFSEAFE